MYKYYLDGILLIDEPQGWSELITSIKRDDGLKGIFQTQEATLTFSGDGYTILKNKFDANFCLQTLIQIWELREESYVLLFDGIIFVSACEVYANLGYITATVEDNSFYAKINNNKNIETHCSIGTSKNLVNYIGAVSVLFRTYNVCNCVYNAQDREGITPYEAFRSLIAFMTDDTVDFESTLLEPGGEWNTATQRLLITSGLKLGSIDPLIYGIGEQLIPKFSFLTLFREIDKNINIGMMVDNTGVRPKIIIEKNSFFYNNESLMQLDNVNGLKIYVDQEKLYGIIHFGSVITLAGTTCPDPQFPEYQDFLSFKDEQYYVLGTCNIDLELNLVRDWVVSSNVIQAVTPPLSDDGYDEDIFLIVCYESGGVNYASQGNPFSFFLPAPRFYNEALLNKNIALRYLGGVPNSITTQLADITDECLIGRVGLNYPGAGTPLRVSTAYTSTYSPVDYNDKTTPPFFDTNNRFTLATDIYTCGPTSGGLYAFEVTQQVEISAYVQETPFNSTPFIHHKLVFQFRINHYNSLAFLLGTYDYWPQVIYSYPPYNGGPIIGIQNLSTQTPLFVLEAGDYIITSLIMTVEKVGTPFRGDFFLNILDGTFGTIFTSKGGGILQPYDPAEYPVFNYDFNYPITPTQFDLIKNSPNKTININIDGVTNIPCFINNAKYNHRTGICNFTLVRTATS